MLPMAAIRVPAREVESTRMAVKRDDDMFDTRPERLDNTSVLSLD